MSQQVCTVCVMDTTDPGISFDARGICSHCHRAEGLLAGVRFTPAESASRLEAIAGRIKAAGKGKEYDVVLGLSGGVDSSYTAYVAHQMGLRPLAVHFDNGWNSEIAVSNIKNIVKVLDFDLETYVINWEEFRDLQRAFIKASVIDIEMLTDHAITAATCRIAREHGIRFVFSGQNYATEHCMPKAWIWNKQDLVNIKAIHRRYGEVPLKTYPMMSTIKYLVARRVLFEYVTPLNNLNYRKIEAMEALKSDLAWRYYGGKHYESLFTKFYQAYILPRKFHVDKRKAHLSSLIRNGEITREDAIAELQKPLYEPNELIHDKDYVLKKLGFGDEEFDRIMTQPPVAHDSFPSDRTRVAALMTLYEKLRSIGLMKQVR